MATESKTYNGWTNYETWNVALWIDNERSDYEHWREAAFNQWESAADRTETYWTRSECARFRLADQLKAEHEEAMPDLGASCWTDLLGAALSEVNWTEIANHLLDGVQDAQDGDEEPEAYESE